jgi:hypothetical protein
MVGWARLHPPDDYPALLQIVEGKPERLGADEMEEFYHLVCRRQARVYGGPTYGTKYSMTGACNQCGTGAEPQGPRIVPKFREPHHPILLTFNGEILVNLDTAKSLEALGVRCLVEVQTRTHDLLPLMELRREAILPPFSPTTTGYERERPCPQCGRDGFFGIPHQPLTLVYEALSQEYRGKQVLWTFERFGNSRLRSPFEDSVVAAPLYVVSKRVMECMRGRDIDFEPVAIEWA